MARMVKCPTCNGTGVCLKLEKQNGEDNIIRTKCNCDNGKVTWKEFCSIKKRMVEVSHRQRVMIYEDEWGNQKGEIVEDEY